MFVKISSNKNIFFFNVHIYYCAPHVAATTQYNTGHDERGAVHHRNRTEGH